MNAQQPFLRSNNFKVYMYTHSVIYIYFFYKERGYRRREKDRRRKKKDCRSFVFLHMLLLLMGRALSNRLMEVCAVSAVCFPSSVFLVLRPYTSCRVGFFLM